MRSFRCGLPLVRSFRCGGVIGSPSGGVVTAHWLKTLAPAYTWRMTFDDQLRNYFGTTDISALAPAALEAGLERMRVDLGLEQDRGRRFALWALMHMLGAAPDLDVAFAEEKDRAAARTFMDLADRAAEL